MLANDVQRALSSGQTKLDSLRQIQKLGEAEAERKRRFEIRDHQLAVTDAFPVFVRRFVKFDYSPDAPNGFTRGASSEQIHIEIPELAPIRVSLCLQVDDKWVVGNSGSYYVVPSITGSEFVGVEWDYRNYCANTSDLELALAHAYELGAKFKDLNAAYQSKQAIYEEVDD